jgi:hypothetical protein
MNNAVREVMAQVKDYVDGVTVNIQVFTATGTYTPTAGMHHCIVEAIGGGASGKVQNNTGGQAGNAGSNYGAGGAGGVEFNQATGAAGGAGAAGYVIVTEFIG